MFVQINNKLATHQPHVVALLQTLLKKSRKVKAFLSRSEAEAVSHPSWTEIDPQLSDVKQLSSASSEQEKFHTFLAAQSLALDEEAWKVSKYSSSQVYDLVA
ncbi:hypothetical protein CIHG_10252 [Coccidioides immitis H538.4]|uniref:Uncharacterized protein n=1 Tax=Coccidioides immitis H538.4 TaxID=396776 RepID=A0A0J8S5I1_COCIT|nr:hypothetical protein CIHG_10252 [Coccidioides immitis H538.4]